jgi:hypothetical protein
MGSQHATDREPALEPCKRILVYLPDDGTDRRLIGALRRDKGVNRVDSVAVRAVGVLQTARKKGGRLPEPALARLVTALVGESEADSVFDYIYVTANIDRPGGGMVVMERLVGATPFVLPTGIPDEEV